MTQPEAKPSPKLRALLLLAGAALLLVWGATLPMAVNAIRDPRGDAFELIPAFWATLTALPLGVMMLIGGITGSDRSVQRGRTALIVAGGLLVLVLLLEILRRVSILMDD